MQCPIGFLSLLFETVKVKSLRIAFEFLPDQVLLQIDIIFRHSITVSLPVTCRQHSVEERKNEKKCGTNILQYLVLIVRQRGLGYEDTEKSLTPVIVQESEVALDVAHACLLHGKHHTKEQEIKVHDTFMCVLHVNNGEPQG